MSEAAKSASLSHVLIVDDHPILRHGITQLIHREPDLAVCADVSSVDEAIEVLASKPVDLMVVDLSLDGRSGLELIRRVKAGYPAIKVLVLSMHDERLYAERVLRAGARGYVMKHEATRKIIVALQTIRVGKIYLSEGVAAELLERLASGPAAPNETGAALPALSDRELEVLQLIGRGMKTGDIAQTLHRSVHTVEAHRANIKRKLGLKSSAELSRAAYELGEESTRDEP